MNLVKVIKHNLYEVIKDYERLMQFILMIKRGYYRLFLRRFHRCSINRYFELNSIKKLQLGCGPNVLEGWLNTDKDPIHKRGILYIDVTKAIPFNDNTFDYVFHEHLIEHLSYGQGVKLIQECWRILKFGGKLRVATPDLNFIMNFYNQEKSEIRTKYLHWIVDTFMPGIGIYLDTFVINNLFYNFGHKFIYDSKLLRHIFEESGFINIKQSRVRESDDLNFQNIDQHGVLVGSEELNDLETMVLEGTKPGSKDLIL